MNKEIVSGIISDVITEKLTQVLEDMSTNEFVDKICDKIYEETGFDVEDDEKREEVFEMIGDKMFPLIQNTHPRGYKVPREIVGFFLSEVDGDPGIQLFVLHVGAEQIPFTRL